MTKIDYELATELKLNARDIAKLQTERMRLLVTTGHPDMARFAHPALGPADTAAAHELDRADGRQLLTIMGVKRA